MLIMIYISRPHRTRDESRPGEGGPLSEKEERFLHFATNAQSFLIDLPLLYRIVLYSPPKPVPFVPDYIQGILHFEGNIWVVVDLDSILGVPPGETLPEYVLVKCGDYHLAFRVRRTRDIVSVPPDRRERQAVPGLPDSCVRFLTVLEGSLTYSLDMERFVEAFSVK